ncbi:MAG: cyclic nucleotide-binding domain-containing protein [Thermoanaerobaculia bacterium]
MTRKVTLSKDALLWEEGDSARNIAIVDSGKLAVSVGGQLVGIVWPKMVIGESALLAEEGPQEREHRTASVVACEDGTMVSEYPASLVRRTFEEGSRAVTNAVIAALVGQICRNCVLIITAQQGLPLITIPLKGLMDGLLQSTREDASAIQKWDEFTSAFRVLYALRDTTEDLRDQLVHSRDTDSITRASEFFRDVFKTADTAQVDVDDYLRAERERRAWLSMTKSPTGVPL